MKSKKIMSIALCAALILTVSTPAVAFADSSFSDTNGHWAEKYIDKAVQKGIVKGYPGGLFKPDNSVKRSEFITMVNKAIGNTGTATVTFSDVPSYEWYYNDVAKAISAAYTGGYDDGTFRPDAKITRQEAAVMISRIVPTYGSSSALTSFKDSSEVASWASSALSKVVGKGYMGAYDDGKLHPTDTLTRAQAAKIINDIVEKENIITSTTTIKSDDTKLSDKIYANGVTVHKDLGDGDATISNCVVFGNLAVQGGGPNSITVQNSRIANASLEKSSDAVRLLLKGETTVNTLDAYRTGTIETSSLYGGDFGQGAKNLNIKGSSKITLKGAFGTVNVVGKAADLTLQSGTITNLNVTSDGRQSDVTIETNGAVTTATVNAESYFHGTGAIRTMEANANKITYETKPSTVNVAGSVTTKPQKVEPKLTIKFNPANGETNVKSSVDPTITFNEAIETYNGKSITSSYLEDNISFRKGGSSGTKVDFTAKINSSDTVITITPSSSLADGKYYLGFAKNVFRNDSTDESIAANSVVWTVGSGDVTFSPADGDKNVKSTVDPTITFSEAVETYAGKTLTASQLSDIIDDDDLYLKKSGSSKNLLGKNDASVNSSKKTITIDPGTLSEGKYILGYKTRTFRTVSGSKNMAAEEISFTVGSSTPTVDSFSPSNGKTGVSLSDNLSLTFSEAMYNSSGSSSFTTSYLNGAVTLYNVTTGKTVSVTNSINSARTRITINPDSDLEAGCKYRITVAASKFKNSAGTYVAKTTSEFTSVTNQAELASVTVNGVDVTNSMKATVAYEESNTAPTANIAAKAKSTGDAVTISKGNASYKDSWENAPLTPGSRSETTFTITVSGSGKTTLTRTLTIAISAPDTKELDAAITEAEAAYNETEVGADPENVSIDKYCIDETAYNNFKAAIDEAKAAKNTVRTNADVTKARGTLAQRTTEFKKARKSGVKVPLNTANLQSAISNANGLLNETKTNEAETEIGGCYTTTQAKATLEAAVSTAIGYLNATDQTDIDNATSTLEQAIQDFRSALKTKTASQSTEPQS